MTYQGKEVFTSDDFDYAAAKPGDYVEEAVVDAAMNCLPPICMSSACAQMGDPYVNTLAALSSSSMLVVLFLAPVVGAIIGGFIARAMFRKHFEKAGLV